MEKDKASEVKVGLRTFREKNILFLVNFFLEKKLLEKFKVDEELKVNVEQQFLYFFSLNQKHKVSKDALFSEFEDKFKSEISFIKEKISFLGSYDDEKPSELLGFKEEWYVNYNYLLTYLQNIYHVKREFFTQVKSFSEGSNYTFDEKPKTPQEQLVSEQKRRVAFRKRFPVHPLFRSDFYPFLTKPKIMVFLKKILFSLSISFALLINAFAFTTIYESNNKDSDSLIRTVFFSDVISLFLIYYLFDRKKREREKYSVSSFLLVFLLIHYFFVWKYLNDIYKSSDKNFLIINLLFICLNLNGVLIIFFVIMTFWKKPKLDKKKIAEANETYRREFEAFLRGEEVSSSSSDDSLGKTGKEDTPKKTEPKKKSSSSDKN